jgi:hypothetical protein
VSMRPHSSSIREAIHLRQRGEYARAWRILRRLHRADPDDARLNYQCAWVCDLRGDERAAVPFYERAIRGGLAGEELRGALLGRSCVAGCERFRKRANSRYFSPWCNTTRVTPHPRWRYSCARLRRRHATPGCVATNGLCYTSGQAGSEMELKLKNCDEHEG